MKVNWSCIKNDVYTYDVYTDTALMRNMEYIRCAFDGRRPVKHSDLIHIDEQLQAEEVVYGSPDGCNRKDKRGEARARAVIEADLALIEEIEREGLNS